MIFRENMDDLIRCFVESSQQIKEAGMLAFNRSRSTKWSDSGVLENNGSALAQSLQEQVFRQVRPYLDNRS